MVPKKEKEKEGVIAFIINSFTGLASLLAGINALSLVGLALSVVIICLIF